MIKQYYGNELYHHGVKGQRWGQRLYQNEDGSLTPLGKARRQALLKKKDKAKIKEQRKIERRAKREDRRALREAREARKRKETKIVRVHDLSKYSDAELREKTARLKIENAYLQELEDYAKYNPKMISTGQKVVNTLSKSAIDALSRAATNAGQAYLEKQFKKMLGVQNDNNNNQNNNNQNNNNNKKEK